MQARVDVAEVLVEVALLEVGAALDGALVLRAASPREELEERGLARAVRADDADALAAAHEELEVREEHAPSALGAEAPGVEHDVAGAGRGREAERDALGGRPHVLGALEALELVEHLAAALRLLGLLAGDVLADEVLGLGDHVLLPLRQRALAREVFLAGDDVVGVAERVDAEAPAPELHGRVGRRCRGRRGRGRRRAPRRGSPRASLSSQRDRVEVEVVGRLVEQEHVGLLREHDAEA